MLPIMCIVFTISSARFWWITRKIIKLNRADDYESTLTGIFASVFTTISTVLWMYYLIPVNWWIPLVTGLTASIVFVMVISYWVTGR